MGRLADHLGLKLVYAHDPLAVERTVSEQRRSAACFDRQPTQRSSLLDKSVVVPGEAHLAPS